jgi:hypothetical protein
MKKRRIASDVRAQVFMRIVYIFMDFAILQQIDNMM